METTEIATNRWTDKQLWQLNKEILAIKKQWAIDTCNHTEGSKNKPAEWNKPYTKECMLCDSIHT